MSLTMGRAQVDDPAKVVSSGARLQVEGAIIPDAGSDAANVAEWLARRQQLVGMVDNPDMDVWPVWSSSDAAVDGFYWVRRAEVSPESSALVNGVGRYRVELERAVNLAGPIVENVTSSVVMTNDHAVSGSATVAAVWGVPADALSVDPPTIVAGQPAAGSRVSEDGALKLYRVDDVVSSAVWTVEPADFWASAARVEAKLSGSTFEPMPGRAVPLTSTNWRIGNGLVRVTPSATSGKLFDVSFWDSSWSAEQAVSASVRFPSVPSYTYSGTYDTLLSAVVLRNSPEACTVRLTVKPSSTSGSSADQAAVLLASHATIDLTVRRGEPLVRMSIAPRNLSGYLAVGVGAASGSQTGITGGVRSNTTVNGGRLLVASPNTFTASTSLGNPGMNLSFARAQGLFGIGYEIDGASAATYNTAQQIAYQYLATLTERQRVVLR